MGNWCQLPRVPNNSLKQLCPIYSSKEVRCTIHIRISLFFVRPHISVRHSYRVAYIFLRRCLISLIRYRARKCNFINGRFSFLCDFFFFIFSSCTLHVYAFGRVFATASLLYEDFLWRDVTHSRHIRLLELDSLCNANSVIYFSEARFMAVSRKMLLKK